MRYTFEIRKFLYSHYFYGGLRIASGVSLPAVLMLLVFHDRPLGFTIATGALGACAVDMPGPLKYKLNDMLACAAIGFLAALATGLATANQAALFVTVAGLAFALSLIVAYGHRWPQISFATLFMMVVTLNDRFTPLQALVNASWILAGGLWYTGWSYLIGRLLWRSAEQQAIAEAIFAVADYLRARANFHDVDADLDEAYRLLVTRQIIAVDKQDAARDIVLRTLPEFRAGALDAERTLLFNLFINTVDLHETVIAGHTDFALLRQTFGDGDVLVFFRDLIRKAAADLDEVGLAVLQNRPSRQRVWMKAELRAIEYELDLLRRKEPAVPPEAYAALQTAFRRVWSATRLAEKMHLATGAAARGRLAGVRPQSEMRIDATLSRFIRRRAFTPTQILSHLTPASPSFRHALRVTAAVAAGFALGKLLPLTNSYWIVLTVIVILKPGFSLTRQRNAQRIVGTALGCALSLALIATIHEPRVLLAIMFACMVMSYSLLLFNYAVSVVFTSSFVLLIYHLLAPESMRLIGERAIDTALGCVLAIGASYLLPYWEYRLMGPLVKKLVGATRGYLDAVWPPAAGAGQDVRYRLARKEMNVAFANLGNAFQRMMLEPKAAQKYVAELNGLLIQSHALASQITAAAPLVTTLGRVDDAALQHAFDTVRAKLRQAELGTGDAVPRNAAADRAAVKALTRELDAMVQTAERLRTVPDDAVQNLKLLAHQCKQMVVAAQAVAQDAGAIRLPV